MGVEDFQVALTCNDTAFSDITNIIKLMPLVHEDKELMQLADEEYFVMAVDNHLIEIEISCKEKDIKISFRFALCHPPSIDNVFYKIIKKIGLKFSMKLKILDEVPKGLPDSFDAPEYADLEHTLKEAIAMKRKYWIQDFGSGTAFLKTSDALKKYVLME